MLGPSDAMAVDDMSEALDEVIESYHRCRGCDEFLDSFYEVFLAQSPEIAKMFAGTNFKIQKMMLRESLLEMLCLEQGMEGAENQIRSLGRRHKELKVQPSMYVMWLDALCEAVKRHDPEYTPELAESWRRAMQKGIDLMISV